MTTLRINDAVAGQMVAELAGTTFDERYNISFSTHHSGSGNFLGGVILKDFSGASAWLHEGSIDPHWMTRDLLWMTFHYPFEQLGMKSLIGGTPRSNTNALAFCLKVGFEYETAIKDCLPGGDDLIITRMWREKCRWLKLRPRGWADNQVPTHKPMPAMGNWLLGDGTGGL